MEYFIWCSQVLSSRDDFARKSKSASMDKIDSMDIIGENRMVEGFLPRGHDMVNARSPSGPGCPVAAFQKLISGKYKLRIVWDLKDGPRRYGEIRAGLLRGLTG